MTEGAGDEPFAIASIDALEKLYGSISDVSKLKETARLTASYRALVAASPFCVLATAGPDGLDCSPRGDAPGFVAVLDDATLLIPDRRGNNRLDSLRNIIADPRVSLLFLVPGNGETLRVNGRASISIDPALTARFAVDGKPPTTILIVTIEAVYFQCARAVLRSRLWSADAQDRSRMPTAGDMVRDCKADFDAAGYDAALPQRQKQTLY